MPNFNKGGYLERSIRSVLEQSVNEIELVVVDDASDDDSVAIVERIQREDDRVLLRKNAKNLGPAASLNVGVKASRAKVLTFLGSDDLFSRDRVERELQIIDDHDGDVVVYSDPIPIEGNSAAVDSVTTKYPFRPSGWIFPDLIAARFSFHGAIITLPRSCLDKVGLFEETLRWGEDLEICLRLAKQYEFCYNPVAGYGYRTYEGNTIRRMSRADRYRYQSRIFERHLPTDRGIDARTRRSAFNILFGCYVASRQWRELAKYGFSSRIGLVTLMTLPLRAFSASKGTQT